MRNLIKLIGLALIVNFFGASSAFAAEGLVGTGAFAMGAGIAIGLGALGGGLGQGRAASSAFDSIGRNPSASGKLQTPMIIGLVFIESLVILAFAIAYLILGKVA